VRRTARLAAALGLVAGGVIAASAPPSTFEEHAPARAPGAPSDPGLTQRFLSAYRGAASERRPAALGTGAPRLDMSGTLAPTRLYATRHIGLEHSFGGR
jgi:hypothetical protein